jgi:hypothetical protein
MTDAIAIHSADIWVKMVEMLQQNWAVIEALDQRPHLMLALASEAPCVVLVRINRTALRRAPPWRVRVEVRRWMHPGDLTCHTGTAAKA